MAVDVRGARTGREGARAIGARARSLLARQEVLVVALLALAASFLAYGSHVEDGGRYLDDWWLASGLRFPESAGFASSWEAVQYYSGWRPLATLYWLLAFDVLGADESLRLSTVFLIALSAGAFYWLLRELGLPRIHAGAIAALALLCPIGDSVRLWGTPSVSQACLSMYLIGAAVSLRAFRAEGRRALLLHGAGVVLYVLSLAIAEIVIPFIALSGVLYATRVPWRRVLRRAAVDFGIAVVAVAHYAASSPIRRANSTSESLFEHAIVMARDGTALFTSYLVPFLRSEGVILLAIVAVVVTAFAILNEQPEGDPRRRAVRRWLVVSGVAALALAAAYVPYLPSVFDPLRVGTGNRVNAAATLPFAVLAYSLIALFASLFPRRPGGWEWARRATFAGLVLVVAAGFALRLADDKRLWAEAATLQRDSMAAIQQLNPDPVPDSAMFVFGLPGAVTTVQRVGFSDAVVSAPVYYTWWEMQSAIKLAYGRDDVVGYPVWAGQSPQIACGKRNVYHFGLDGVRHAVPYGRAYFVDIRSNVSEPVLGEAQCRKLADQIKTSVFAVSI